MAQGDYEESGFSIPKPAEVDGFDKWTARELSSYFDKNGLGQYSEAIIKHKINGRLAPMLVEKDLETMGMKCIGDRLRFQLHIDNLKRSLKVLSMSKCVWEGEERIFYNRTEAACCTLNGFCPVDPSQYKLMANYLKIRNVNPARCGPIRLCCCNEYSINNIDLTYISDVDVTGIPAPWHSRVLCCAPGKDLVNIEIRGYGGNEMYRHRLVLKEGLGNELASLLMTSIEKSARIDRE